MRKCEHWNSSPSALRAQEIVARKHYGPSALAGRDPGENETLKTRSCVFCGASQTCAALPGPTEDGSCGEDQGQRTGCWRPGVTGCRLFSPPVG